MRVALVTGPDPGHLIPVAGLAVRLRAAGHDTVIATSERWRVPLERDGLGWVALPMIAAQPGDADLGQRMHVRPTHIARPLAEVLATFGPDIVVSDTLTRPGALAASVLGCPWVELIPHPLPDPSIALPPFGTGWWPPRPRRDARARARTARSVAAGDAQRTAALAAAGLPDIAPVVRLVATWPALEPARPDWPVNAVIVGPLSWEPAQVDLPVPPGDTPVVVVVGSTASGAARSDLFAAVRAAGADGRWRVLGPRFEPSPVSATQPSWVATGVGRLAPLLAAADVVVAPGGHGLVAAALAAGVPLVVVPGAGDQKETGSRVARVGAGLRLRRPTPRALRRAISEVLGNTDFSEAARRAASPGDIQDPVVIVDVASQQPR